MARKVARLSARVHEDHPLFHLVDNNKRGTQIILNYATAWYGYLEGMKEQSTSSALDKQVSKNCSKSDEALDELLDDALS